ncbi:MAG: hypothetical protein KIT00_09960 [Rhodospirillales bacterium]|nr:hypothetical protein [Rhodospirillales bacterium]
MRYSRGVVALLAVVVGLLVTPAVGNCSQPPTVFDLLRQLGLTLGDHDAILGGKIVAADLPRKRSDELAASVVAFLPAGMNDVADIVLHGGTGEGSAEGVMGGTVRMPVNEADWRGVGYSVAEESEVSRLLAATPGSSLNLSMDEIARIRSNGLAEQGGQIQSIGSVSDTYKSILMNRFSSYMQGGLTGISPYARGDNVMTSPTETLRIAFADIRPFLAKYFPDFVAAVDRFPAMAGSVEHRFSWRKDEVDGRPAFILNHDIIDRTPGYCLLGQRQFFVSHSYDSMQDITLLLAVRDGTMMYRFVRTYTDRVAGPFNGFEREIGQNMVKASLIENAERLRKHVSGNVSAMH